MMIFHSYVSLPEGIFNGSSESQIGTPKTPPVQGAVLPRHSESTGTLRQQSSFSPGMDAITLGDPAAWSKKLGQRYHF